jgi:hypothetical protein
MKYALGNMLNGAGGFNPDGLSLDLQFAADKTLTARKGPTPAFTRASTGTFIGSNGLIQSAAVDAARFDHDPLTFACKGLLLEESRRNLLLQSQTFSVTWIPVEVTVSTDVTQSPDGITNADLIIPSATNSIHRLQQSTACSSSTNYTVSLYVKPNGYSKIGFMDLNATSAYATFNCVGSGSVLDQGLGITGRITQAGSGWYRIDMLTTTGAAQTTYRINIYVLPDSYTTGLPSSIWTPNGTSGMFVYGAQIEAGSFATSYIPTTSSALTRSADVCSITGSNFTGMYNQTEGAMLVDAFTPASGIRNIVSCLTVFNKEITLLTNISAAELEVIDGVSQVDMSSGSPISPNTAFKLACAYKLNDFAVTKDNVTPQTDTSGTVPTVDAMIVGSGPAGNTMCGCVSSLRYYRKRLSDEKIQTLTAT